MNISIDFDETYTEDPQLWNAFIRAAQASGHTIYCVTARHNVSYETKEVLESIGALIGEDKCIFTSRMGKRATCFNRNINIHVWIDDTPDAIVAHIYTT